MAVFGLDFYTDIGDTTAHMNILRRNISLMLAVRYLNPLRTMFSVITLICLGGVALGVMVLIVVLSVMEGLQKEMEEKGFALQPHYTATLHDAVTGVAKPITEDDCDWLAVQEELKQLPNVASVYPRLESMAFIQTDKNRSTTLSFRAVESANEQQMLPLKSMLKAGSFDLGLDNACVVSYKVAKDYKIEVGDRLTLTPVSANIEQMAEIMQKIEGELVTHTDADLLPALTELTQDARPCEDGVLISVERRNRAILALLPYVDMAEAERRRYCRHILGKDELSEKEKAALQPQLRKMRTREADLCADLFSALCTMQEAIPQSQEEMEQWQQQVEALRNINKDEANGQELEALRSLVVPVDLDVIGIYQTPENMPGPDIYLPLNVAQESVGYNGNHIMGICLRLENPHTPGNIKQQILDAIARNIHPTINQEDFADMPAVDAVDYSTLQEQTDATETETTLPEPEPAEASAPAAHSTPAVNNENVPPASIWNVSTWKDTLEAWYKLIANERVMMSFVLSIITLIASFCIMAVMFTISLQRKREIAVLQALGATRKKIIGIFAWQGIIIGLVGAGIGIELALLVLDYRLEIQQVLASVGLDPFPMEAHGITLPAVYNADIFVKQAIVAFIMVTIASIIPAIFVSRQDPAKALRSN